MKRLFVNFHFSFHVFILRFVSFALIDSLTISFLKLVLIIPNALALSLELRFLLRLSFMHEVSLLDQLFIFFLYFKVALLGLVQFVNKALFPHFEVFVEVGYLLVSSFDSFVLFVAGVHVFAQALNLVLQADDCVAVLGSLLGDGFKLLFLGIKVVFELIIIL